MIKELKTHNAPSAIGPYSQAVIANDLLFISGQLGIDSKTNVLQNGIEAQTKKSLENIKAILSEVNISLNNVIKCTIFVQDINDFSKVNQIYSSFFGNHRPSRSTIEVSRLPKDALVEIEAIALINNY